MASLLVRLRRQLSGATRSSLVVLLGCLGCAQTLPSAAVQTVRAPQASLAAPADDGIRLVQHTELPAPKVLPDNTGAAGAPLSTPVAAPAGDKVLPINLDSVLRLAQDQNGQ